MKHITVLITWAKRSTASRGLTFDTEGSQSYGSEGNDFWSAGSASFGRYQGDEGPAPAMFRSLSSGALSTKHTTYINSEGF